MGGHGKPLSKLGKGAFGEAWSWPIGVPGGVFLQNGLVFEGRENSSISSFEELQFKGSRKGKVEWVLHLIRRLYGGEFARNGWGKVNTAHCITNA